MVALPLPRRTRGGGSGSLFFITVAARQWQMLSRDGHLWRLLTFRRELWSKAQASRTDASAVPPRDLATSITFYK